MNKQASPIDQEPKDKRTIAYKEWKAKYEANPPKKGAGDVIKSVLDNTGISNQLEKLFDKLGIDCNCEERQAKANELLPNRFKPRCFTEEEYSDYKSFREERTLIISRDQIRFVSKLYSDVFNITYYEPCASCSPKLLIGMMDKLDILFETYE